MALTALVRIAPHCVRAINQPDHSALNKPASQHQEGKAQAQVAREMGCKRQHVRAWVLRAKAITGDDPRINPLKEDERAELERLRRENDRLRLEAEILKKAAALFARELK